MPAIKALALPDTCPVRGQGHHRGLLRPSGSRELVRGGGEQLADRLPLCDRCRITETMPSHPSHFLAVPDLDGRATSRAPDGEVVGGQVLRAFAARQLPDPCDLLALRQRLIRRVARRIRTPQTGVILMLMDGVR
jgi:hypothetical protein